MIEKLSIKNFVLVDSCEISFQRGLNVITGETGAGKSIILAALSFLLGDRADVSVIRQETDKALVEGLFSIKAGSAISKALKNILDEAGVDYCEDDELIIRREITTANKSRAFINNQPAHIGLIKKVAPCLIEFSGQHAHLSLLQPEAPRNLLDAFADLETQLLQFEEIFHKERQIEREIERIETTRGLRLQTIDRIGLEIEEISEAKLQEGEEERLLQEVGTLSHQEELTQKLHELIIALEGDRGPIIRELVKQKTQLERLASFDPALQELGTRFHSIVLELQEALFEIKRYHSKLEFHPDRLSRVEKRLQEITHIKRKYGETATEIEARKETLQKRLLELENEENVLDELKKELLAVHAKTTALALAITEKRTKAAHKLSGLITKEIRSFNMPNARFEIILTPAQRTAHGDEKIEFHLAPNLGEKCMPIQDAASGGELARLSLAMQILLRDKAKTPTILFDEIDANIGGETATIIGEKLQLLGKTLQVVSITHFAQVALYADTHFCIAKKEKAGRTYSTVNELENSSQKQEEITRMLGGKLNLNFSC